MRVVLVFRIVKFNFKNKEQFFTILSEIDDSPCKNPMAMTRNRKHFVDSKSLYQRKIMAWLPSMQVFGMFIFRYAAENLSIF